MKRAVSRSTLSLLCWAVCILVVIRPLLAADPLDSWTRQATQRNLHSVVFGNNTYVAIGGVTSGGVTSVVILTSPDGTNWIHRPNGLTTNSLFRIVYGAGTFVAVGDGGTIITSEDGISWTRRNSHTSGTVRDISFGNGVFIAVGGGAIQRSVDGRTWSREAAVEAASYYPFTVAFGGGRFLALGTTTANATSPTLSSTDGKIWVTRWTDSKLDDLRKVTYGNGIFVGAGAGGSGSSIIKVLTSADGLSWTERPIKAPSEFINPDYPFAENYGFLTDVTSGNGSFVAVGAFYPRNPISPGVTCGLIVTSPDGISWFRREIQKGVPLRGVAYHDGKFLSVGDGILQSGLMPRPFFRLEEIVRQSDGTLQLVIESQMNAVLTVEASVNLEQWTSVANATNLAGTVTIRDAKAAALTQRFYRVKQTSP